MADLKDNSPITSEGNYTTSLKSGTEYVVSARGSFNGCTAKVQINTGGGLEDVSGLSFTSGGEITWTTPALNGDVNVNVSVADPTGLYFGFQEKKL